jgi:hypothetical protein
MPGAPLLLERRAEGGEWRRVWLVPEELPGGRAQDDRGPARGVLGLRPAGGCRVERAPRPADPYLFPPVPRLRVARDAHAALFICCCIAAWEAVYSGITLFLPALSIHFFALFPEGGPRSGRIEAVVRAAYTIATLLFAAVFAELLAPPGLEPGRARHSS